LQLAKMLIKASATDKLDLGKYKDVYMEKLSKLIEAKVAGQELVTPPPSEPAHVINLMDALRQSVERMKQATGGADAGQPALEAAGPAARKPPRKMAPSKGTKPIETKKRKSS
jgi:DNA end-binding protein Ku